MTDLSNVRALRRPSRRAILLGSFVAALGALGVGCLTLKSCTPGTLEIHVVEGDKPVAGAKAGLVGRLAMIGETYVVRPSRPAAGDDGVLLFENVDAGAYRMSVTHDDFLAHVEDDVAVVGGERRVVTIALRRGVRIRGRLLNPSGAPMAGVSVNASAERRAPDGALSFEGTDARAETNEDGTFLTTAAAPGAALLVGACSFRDGAAYVAQRLVADARVGVNEIGDLRVLDTETVLRLDGEPPRDDVRARGAVEVALADGGRSSIGFVNVWFVPDGRAHVFGLPEGALRWNLYEARLGPAPNERVVGEGQSELVGRRREVALRRTAVPK